MKIIETDFNWNGKLTLRSKTRYIILHHSAGSTDVKSVHNQHKRQGYIGIGYHYFIDDDGNIYSGRADNTVGAHCIGYNNESIGICFNGNFEIKKTDDKQIKAGLWLVSYLKDKYFGLKIIRHSDAYKTLCPGKYFPFEVFENYDKGAEKMTAEEQGKFNNLVGVVSDLSNRVTLLQNKMVYNYVDNNMPPEAASVVKKLISKGFLKGNENGELGLTDSDLRHFIINDRAGLYD